MVVPAALTGKNNFKHESKTCNPKGVDTVCFSKECVNKRRRRGTGLGTSSIKFILRPKKEGLT